MRSVIYDFISQLNLGTYSLSSELPWNQSGQPLYLSNLKRIYVDVGQSTQDPVANILDSRDLVDEITTVRVYFVNDAKQLPSNYETVVNNIKQARNATGTEGFVSRVCNVSTEYDVDRLVTTFDFSFRKLLTN